MMLFTPLLAFGVIVLLVILLLRLVGPSMNSDGALSGPSTIRYAKTGEQTMTQTHGKYYEGSSRGTMFAACEQGTGIAPGTALGTTACFALYNPPGSGKRLAIQKVSLGYKSGTLGAGTVYHAVDKTTTQAAPSSGTALTAVCSDIGSGSAPVGVARVGGTVAATVVAYRPFAILDASLASTVSSRVALTEDVDGEIVIEPGCSYQLQSVTATGSSPLVIPAVTWEEVPIV